MKTAVRFLWWWRTRGAQPVTTVTVAPPEILWGGLTLEWNGSALTWGA